jgi:hypothetical protein
LEGFRSKKIKIKVWVLKILERIIKVEEIDLLAFSVTKTTRASVFNGRRASITNIAGAANHAAVVCRGNEVPSVQTNDIPLSSGVTPAQL